MSTKVILDRDKEYNTWSLTILVSNGDYNLSMHIEEPQLISYKEWLSVLNHGGRLAFYMGNGEGYMKITDNICEFCAAPSGGGGDVTLSIMVPLNLFKSELLAKLQEAKNAGYNFSK